MPPASLRLAGALLGGTFGLYGAAGVFGRSKGEDVAGVLKLVVDSMGSWAVVAAGLRGADVENRERGLCVDTGTNPVPNPADPVGLINLSGSANWNSLAGLSQHELTFPNASQHHPLLLGHSITPIIPDPLTRYVRIMYDHTIRPLSSYLNDRFADTQEISTSDQYKLPSTMTTAIRSTIHLIASRCRCYSRMKREPMSCMEFDQWYFHPRLVSNRSRRPAK